MRIESLDTSLDLRTPLRPVPLHKRRKSPEQRLKSTTPLSANGLLEGNVIKKKDNVRSSTSGGSWLMKKPLTIDTILTDSEAASTSGEHDHLTDSDYASLSVTPAASDQVDESEVRCCVWDWRTTHIGGFMKKNRIISLKRRTDALKIEKPLPTYDADIGKLPNSKPNKRSKYNPHQEYFVTDVSHRSRRCATFRTRPHTRLHGPVNDGMLQKVQVPVDASHNEPKVEFAKCDLTTVDTPINDEHNRTNVEEPSIERVPLITTEASHRIGRLSEPVADFLINSDDIKFWKQLNWKLWAEQSGSLTRRDENNHQLALPPIVMLRKTDFIYILSMLETTCFNEIHSTLLELLNVPNQDVDDNAFCEICQSDHSDQQDPIVFCEGCELAVHQHCYAFDELPKKDWFCNVCRTLGNKAQVRCRFCPLSWGTMKQTIEGGWAHFACAVWQQSLRFDNLNTYEPISHEWDVNSDSFTKTCSICDLCYGSCIMCSVPNCKIPFHPTCGLRGRLYMFIEDNSKSKIGVKLFSFCVYHSEKARQVRSRSNNRMESVLQLLNVPDLNISTECYKKSRICKMESSFERFVNWKRLADEVNLPRDLMKSIFAHWIKRRRQAGNRPLVPISEANEIFVSSRFREDVARNAIKRMTNTRMTDEDIDGMIKDYTKAHCVLDKFRNLATLSVRRERMKLSLVSKLREAFDEITNYLDGDSHLNDRSLVKIAALLQEHIHGPDQSDSFSRSSSTNSEETTSVQSLEVNSNRKRRLDVDGHNFVAPKVRRTAHFPQPFNKIQEIFAELFDLDENLSEELFKSLPTDCL
ncbi:hypothetical protein M3Y94_00387600 [Aphelenchoides besseyi]|nr:hypothetical protein M3Y94_00387600 [Aphelenchoides besseyi]KAI6235028.1 hypothetical protein M3Y95_00008100 [Aphelenchoides besseyi]